MHIRLLTGEEKFRELPGQHKKLESLLEEKIISVLNSVNDDVSEIIRETQHNNIERGYLKSRIKNIERKMKHIKRLIS